MAHINAPGHTDGRYRYDDQTQRNIAIRRYSQRLDGDATHQLEAILEHLKNNDPDAILYVYGDHGPWLSRGMSFDDNPAFVVQDRLGVLGGVYPPDACATYFDETLSKGYMTALDGVHAILRCLSGGPKRAQDAAGASPSSQVESPPVALSEAIRNSCMSRKRIMGKRSLAIAGAARANDSDPGMIGFSVVRMILLLAYVDPGSAGFIVTTVLGVLAAGGYITRVYLNRLKQWVFPPE